MIARISAALFHLPQACRNASVVVTIKAGMLRSMEERTMLTPRISAIGAVVLAALAAAALPAWADGDRRGWGHDDGRHRGRPHWVHPQYGPSYWAPPPVRYRPAPVYVAPPVVYPPPVIVYPAYPAYPVYPAYPNYYGPRGGVNLGIQIPLY
jgi:hypothetical protein